MNSLHGWWFCSKFPICSHSSCGVPSCEGLVSLSTSRVQRKCNLNTPHQPTPVGNMTPNSAGCGTSKWRPSWDFLPQCGCGVNTGRCSCTDSHVPFSRSLFLCAECFGADAFDETYARTPPPWEEGFHQKPGMTAPPPKKKKVTCQVHSLLRNETAQCSQQNFALDPTTPSPSETSFDATREFLTQFTRSSLPAGHLSTVLSCGKGELSLQQFSLH